MNDNQREASISWRIYWNTVQDALRQRSVCNLYATNPNKIMKGIKFSSYTFVFEQRSLSSTQSMDLAPSAWRISKSFHLHLTGISRVLSGSTDFARSMAS